ncbi:MAG TPA: hypothetical protein VFO36_11620 [Nitrospiraceae bacterium]|nr:hypothetical protein [Nitrospiraceae bacterium]
MRAIRLSALTLCVLLGLSSVAAHADIVVIVHPSYPAATLNKADFARLYLGRTTTFPGGKQANAIDLAPGPVREQMLSQLLEKTDSEVAHIWSKLVFSGNAKSLPRVADEAAMIERVAGDPNAIGYVDAKSVKGSVKVLTLQ